jgi:metallo-beta-lactamase-like protein
MGLRVAYTGHQDPVTSPAERAREIRAHHEMRLDDAVAALDGTPLSPYDVSLSLFPVELPTTLRRFATAESLAHLERLVADGRAARADGGYVRIPFTS